MQLDPDQLLRHLQRELAPLYVVHGEEALLAIEAADRIRTKARERGCSEREILTVEAGFEWRRLWATGASLSLFASQRLVELRMASAAPGAEGSEALIRYAASLPEDTVTLITLPKVEFRTRQSKWFSALESAGVCVHAQRIGFEQLPAWLAARLKAQGQSAGPDVMEVLAARVEGNLLAAHQEIQKLSLLFPQGPLDLDAVRTTVADVARFDAFDLGPAILAGDPVHLLRMLDGLRGEGTGLPLVLWAFAEEIRAMLRIRESVASGMPLAQAMRDAKVWGERQKGMPAAVRRLDSAQLRNALAHAARIDRIIKGVGDGDAWTELEQLAMRLTAPDLKLPTAHAA
ncbi:MAG: DNA polymerase III subunit delta [Betaproteobacteria bacterium]|nr:DNA polymerase III subunit delta [Betaproteobacteria bacterium]